MTYEQFLDLCILCGSDYNTKIPGMGVISAYRNLKECGNIEGIIAKGTYKIPNNFEYQRVRDLYLNNPMEINEEDYRDLHIMKKSQKNLWDEVLQKNNIQLDMGIQLLVDKYFFPELYFIFPNG
jgi:5'-3' exonuclease